MLGFEQGTRHGRSFFSVGSFVFFFFIACDACCKAGTEVLEDLGGDVLLPGFKPSSVLIFLNKV